MEITAEQITEKWAILVWSLGFGFMMLTLAFQRGLLKPFKINTSSNIQGKYVLAGFVLFILMQLAVVPFLISSFLILFGWNLNEILAIDPITKAWLALPIILGGFIGAGIAFNFLNKSQKAEILNQTTIPWYKHLVLGIVVWFVVYPFVLAFSELIELITWYLFNHTPTEQIVVQNFKQTLKNPLLFSLTALEIIFIVPITEELLFRGLLQNWLKGKFNHPLYAIIGSSLVFALFHFSKQQGLTNIELLSSLFLLGCVLGLLYERQRSLWAPIGLHGFFNFMSLLLLYISK